MIAILNDPEPIPPCIHRVGSRDRLEPTNTGWFRFKNTNRPFFGIYVKNPAEAEPIPRTEPSRTSQE